MRLSYKRQENDNNNLLFVQKFSLQIIFLYFYVIDFYFMIRLHLFDSIEKYRIHNKFILFLRFIIVVEPILFYIIQNSSSKIRMHEILKSASASEMDEIST